MHFGNLFTASTHCESIVLLQILQQLEPTENDIMWIFIVLMLLFPLVIELNLYGELNLEFGLQIF